MAQEKAREYWEGNLQRAVWEGLWEEVPFE
jgi:hypothetical protein